MVNHPVKHIILGVAIALVLVFFVAFAVQTFYPAPEYDDYCEERLTFKAIDSAEECVGDGGRWSESPARDVELKSVGYCDVDYTCRAEFDVDSDAYERNVFFVNLVIGLIVLVLSFFLSVEAVSSGLMGGGVIMIVYGTIRYWGALSDVWRTLMLGVALAILVVVGYKKLK